MRCDNSRKCRRGKRGVVNPVCTAKGSICLQNSWLLLLLLLGEEMSDALAREESNPWPAPHKHIAGRGDADALYGLSGENFD